MSFHPGRIVVTCVFLAIAQLVLIPQANAGTCGVLPFTHGADVAEGAGVNITSLVSTELDFRGPWTIVVTASKQEITDGCGADPSCLLAFGKGESHDSVVTGTIAAAGSDKYRITTRWYEVGTGRMKREAVQEINRSADLLIEEVPGLVTELLTGEKPASPEEQAEESDEFASLDEIDFDDLDEDEDEDEEVRPRARPKRDNRGRLREPVRDEEDEDPFGFDVDDLDDIEEVERKNEKDRIAAIERAEREEEQRKARAEERRRAERIAEERRREEQAEERAREERREREREARERAEREREEEEKRARAERRAREREEREREEREVREREERRERERIAEERREREEREERERLAAEREEREERERLAEERRRAREDEELAERRQRDDRDERARLAEERRLRREADRKADEERRERAEREAEEERLAARSEDEPEVDYADVQLGSALAAGAISFSMEDADEDDEGYVGFTMEDADEDDDDGYISMEPAEEEEEDEPRVGDLVSADRYEDPGARRRAAAAERASGDDDRYSRARSFGRSSSDDDDDDEYTSVDTDGDLDLDERDDRTASRDDRRKERSRQDRSSSRDDGDGTYRYRPRDRDLDDDDYESDYGASRSRRSGATASASASDPSARRHISIRGSGGVSKYYLWFGQYGIDVGIFPIDPLSIDLGAEGWSLSLTEQAEDEDGNLLWDDNGQPVTQTELRTLPHLSVGASWRGNFHRVVKPYAGGDVGAIMYATEKHSDGSSTPRFGVTGVAKGGADFMFTRVLGAHVGVRVGVAYSPMVEELVYFEWNPVEFVFNVKAGLTLAF